MSNQIDQDAKLIESLGGAAKVAEVLGLEKQGGVQRVHNWVSRGIPSHIKVAWPELFMPDLKQPKRQTAKAA